MREAITAEQAFLDDAFHRRDELLDELRRDLAASASAPGDGLERQRIMLVHRRIDELERAETGLVFGRLDGLDGSVRRLGRVGIPAPGHDGEPVVVDWRASVARPFYTATPLDNQGQARRRHVQTDGRRVIGVDDEPLDPSADGGDLVGEAALLRALSSPRTGHMGTAVATMQREQDAAVRADTRGPLVVQGGPGTGKTVVALHRVAYLLFTHPQLAERGVLLVGPSSRFLDYIARVLPALGESQVVTTTCERLMPGVVVSRTETREAAEIKGRAVWQQALTDYVTSLTPTPCDLAVTLDGETYLLPARQVAAALQIARSGGRGYHHARRLFHERFCDLLAEAVVQRSEELLAAAEEGLEDVLAGVDASLADADDRGVPLDVHGAQIDGVLSEEEIDALRTRIGDDPQVAAALATWWPVLDVTATLRHLLSDAQEVRRFAPGLTDAEIGIVTSRSGRSEGWAPSDVPLLDALTDLLAPDLLAPDVLAPDPVTGSQGEFQVKQAAARRDWVYGHVVVDEAQELSAMQWQMLLRRCPTRSFTIVGDIDQTEAPHRHTSWRQALQPVFDDRWTPAHLTICYRTPREVMALAEPVLRHATSPNQPPRSVRSTGITPWTATCTRSTLSTVVSQSVTDLQSRYQTGTLAVIAPACHLPAIRSSRTDHVPVLTPADAKGLEFDAVLVVDPETIASQPRGWNALYVALTRCTQELGQIEII